MPFLSPLFTLRRLLCVTKCLQGYLSKHAFWCSFVWIYSSMLKKAEESSIQYSCRVDVAVCVRALQMCVCVCVRALQMCVCVHAFQMCVSVCARFRCVCARASGVCVCALQMCVCACARFSARKTSHTARDCYSNNPERLLCSPRAFGQSLYRVLIREIEWECTR